MDYLSLLKNRLTLRGMQRYCAKHGIPTATGWDRLHEKFEIEKRKGVSEAREMDKTLQDIYLSTLTLGNRAVRLFEVPEEEVKTIFEIFSTLQPEESAYAETYPLPLSGMALKGAPEGLFLSEVRLEGEALSLIYCGRRTVEEREPRRRDEISKAAIHQFGWDEYDEFIFIKYNSIQVYEVIRVDLNRKLVELRAEDHTGVDVTESINELQVKAGEILVSIPNDRINFIHPVNIFPAISSIYRDEAEGVVIDLGFTTATGSSKHEKMTRSKTDLREELFHVGGKAAIGGALTPFKIAVRWKGDENRPDEFAILPGSIRQLGSAHPQLNHFVLRGPVTEEHMRERVDRVMAHVKPKHE